MVFLHDEAGQATAVQFARAVEEGRQVLAQHPVQHAVLGLAPSAQIEVVIKQKHVPVSGPTGAEGEGGHQDEGDAQRASPGPTPRPARS